jgi:hypothetical protein
VELAAGLVRVSAATVLDDGESVAQDHGGANRKYQLR